LVLRDLKTTPNLAEVLCGWIGMMIQVGAWGSLQDLTGLAPTRGFIGRCHWTTHTSKTINIIYSPTTLYPNSHFDGASLKVTGHLTLLLNYYYYICSSLFILFIITILITILLLLFNLLPLITTATVLTIILTAQWPFILSVTVCQSLYTLDD
jgi:hypothetical protein